MLRSVVRFHLAPPQKSWSEGYGTLPGGARISIEHLSNIRRRGGRSLSPVAIHVRTTSKGRRYDVKLRSADGGQHSKTFATKKEATEYEGRQLTAMADGRWITPGPGPIVEKHVIGGLGADRQGSRISRADCQALVDGWLAAGLASRTVIRNAAVLRAMLQLGVDADLIARNPAARLKLPGVGGRRGRR